jgi:SAM-dependent methyltransferase
VEARPNAFKDHFSRSAEGYRAFRPRYPSALIEWLVRTSRERRRAVDLGCGTGQASVGLAIHFDEVIGVDASADQIARADPHPRVSYRVAPAESTGIAATSADLIVAAQSFHWFDLEGVVREVERIARPDASFAAFTYGLCRVDPAVDGVVDRLSRDVLGTCWPRERAHVDDGYRALRLPWPETTAPDFAMQASWSLAQLAGYLGTWSAASVYRELRGEDPLEVVARQLAAAWGPPERKRAVRWEVAMRAARVARR